MPVEYRIIRGRRKIFGKETPFARKVEDGSVASGSLKHLRITGVDITVYGSGTIRLGLDDQPRQLEHDLSASPSRPTIDIKSDPDHFHARYKKR